MAGEPDGSMTLVLALSAVKRLERPAEVIVDTREWSRVVGVVGDDESELTAAIERTDAEPDFVSGEGGTAGTLSAIRQRFSTERHVFVSADGGERQTAQALGWEFLTVQEAAEKAEWALTADSARADRWD